jgi:hypothetical protein
VIVTEKATVKLNQVTRDAKMLMKFLSTDLSSELALKFNNQSMKINILTKNNQEIQFTVENRDSENS